MPNERYGQGRQHDHDHRYSRSENYGDRSYNRDHDGDSRRLTRRFSADDDYSGPSRYAERGAYDERGDFRMGGAGYPDRFPYGSKSASQDYGGWNDRPGYGREDRDYDRQNTGGGAADQALGVAGGFGQLGGQGDYGTRNMGYARRLGQSEYSQDDATGGMYPGSYPPPVYGANADIGQGQGYNQPGYGSQGTYGQGSAGMERQVGENAGRGAQRRGAQSQQTTQFGQEEDDFDPDYRQWRQSQMDALDDDYRAYRRDRQKKFSDDFESYRKGRDRSTASGDSTTQSASGKSTSTTSSAQKS